jgi:Ni,Fe-hydrogenase III small subunit
MTVGASEATQQSRAVLRINTMKTNLLRKTFATRRPLIGTDVLAPDAEAYRIGEAVAANVRKLFRGSLAIRVVTAGSTNACEQELVALGNCFYDVERFGVHFVASPRHADMLMVTGPVSRNMREALIRTYEAMPEPRIVVAVGDDAIDGGLFRGSYAVCDGARAVIPVHYEIPGDPPSPIQILRALLDILTQLDAPPSR